MNRLTITIFILFSFYCTNSYGGNSIPAEKMLIDEINTESDTIRKLELITKLLNSNFDFPNHFYWFSRQADLAGASGHFDVRIKALANLARISFNNRQFESLLYWIDLVENESIEHDNYKHYYDVKIYECMYHILKRNFSVATDKVMMIKEDAEKRNSITGKAACHQALGLIAYQTHNNDEAIRNLEYGIELLRDDSEKIGSVSQMYLYLLMVTSRAEDVDKHNAVLEELSSIIESERSNSDHSVIIGKLQWYIYYYKFVLHTNTGNRDSASFYLNNVMNMNGDVPLNYSNLQYVRSKYHVMLGEYDKALECINTIVNSDHSDLDEFIKYQAYIYSLIGNDKMANDSYVKAYKLLKESRETLFKEEFEVTKKRNELFHLKSQASDMQFSLNKTRNKAMLHLVIFLTVIFLMVIALLLYNHIYKKKILKTSDSLIKEKDILEVTKKRLELLLAQADESLRKKNSFLATMSHEIRTPLNAIVGFSELITRDDNITEEEKEYSAIIHHNSELLLKLVNDIVNISRIESETIVVDRSDVDIIECARNTVRSIEKLTSDKVVVSFTPHSEVCMFNTDLCRVTQILTNVLGNAAKFTAEGEINLSIYPKDDMLVFAVSDTGSGIPAGKHESVFNRYEKLDESSSGTGLGLSICKMIAEKLKGRIYVDPSYSDGTRIVFEHPIIKFKND